MFAAMLGAIKATDRPTAAHTDSDRLSPGALDGLGFIWASSLCSIPIVSLRLVRHGRGKWGRNDRRNQQFPERAGIAPRLSSCPARRSAVAAATSSPESAMESF